MRTISGKLVFLAAILRISTVRCAEESVSAVSAFQPISGSALIVFNHEIDSVRETSHIRILASDDQFTSSRSIIITLQNKSSKKLTTPTTYFDQGELFKPLPLEIMPNQTGTFYLKKKFGLFGIKGVICYRFNNKSDVVIFFENPYFGPNWYGADLYENLSRSAKVNYKEITKTPAKVPVTNSRSSADVYYLGLSGERTSMNVVITGKGSTMNPFNPRRLAIISVTERVPALTSQVLISKYGTCLCESPDGAIIVKEKGGICDKWTLVALSGRQYYLQSPSGRYLAASQNGRVCPRAQVDKSSVWTRVDYNGRIAWRSVYKLYLTGHQDGNVDLKAKAACWETDNE